MAGQGHQVMATNREIASHRGGQLSAYATVAVQALIGGYNAGGEKALCGALNQALELAGAPFELRSRTIVRPPTEAETKTLV